MKLLHILPTYKPAYIYGGTVTAVALLCENLVSKGNCEVTVISTTANGAQDLPTYKNEPVNVDGVDVFYFKRITKEPLLLAPPSMWFLFRNVGKYDAVHIHSWWNLPVILSMCVCLIRGVKPVFSPHGMLSPFTVKGKFKPLFHKYIGQKLLKNTYLLTTSTQEANECLALNPNWQHSIIPNLIDLDSLPNSVDSCQLTFDSLNGLDNCQISTDNCQLNLLFLSRLHPKKGAELLFEALAKVNFNWSLTMAGGGEAEYLEQLKKQCDKLNISDKINWIGWVNAEERRAAFESADLLVLPSHNENFALVVIESLAVGTPVLVSKFVGISDYVAEKNLGWVCDTTVESIIEKLEEANNNKAKRQHISENSGNQVRKDFDPTVLVNRYKNLYRNSMPSKIVDPRHALTH